MVKEKITENKVIVENGEIKTILTEETKQSGWMGVDEFVRLGDEWINKMKEMCENENLNK